jgi:hypothetical protein
MLWIQDPADLRLRMVVHLDQLAPYHGAAQNKWSLGGSSWRVIAVRTKIWRRNPKPIPDVTSTVLRKEEMVVCP